MEPSNPKLCAALVKAQEAVRAAKKDAHNQHDRHDYASREGIVSTAKAALSSNGLAYMFIGPRQINVEAQTCTFEAILIHESGEQMWWKIEWPLNLAETTKQGNLRMQAEKRAGMAKTYAEKNTLLGVLQIPRGAEDLDGTPNEGGYAQAPERQKTKPKRSPEATAMTQIIKGSYDPDTIRAAAEQIGLTGLSLGKLNLDQLTELRESCQTIKAQMEAETANA